MALDLTDFVCVGMSQDIVFVCCCGHFGPHKKFVIFLDQDFLLSYSFPGLEHEERGGKVSDMRTSLS